MKNALVLALYAVKFFSANAEAATIRFYSPGDWVHTTAVAYFDGVNHPTSSGMTDKIYGVAGEAVDAKFSIHNDLVFENFWFNNNYSNPRIISSPDGMIIPTDSAIYFIHGASLAWLFVEPTGAQVTISLFNNDSFLAEETLTLTDSTYSPIEISADKFDEVRIRSVSDLDIISLGTIYLMPEPSIFGFALALVSISALRRKRVSAI